MHNTKINVAFALLCFLMAGVGLAMGQGTVTGKKWDNTTLDFQGPATSELAMPNPFTYYRLDVTFTHEDGHPIMVVPGYYAADGKAGNSSANTGNIWRVHFAAPKTGTWKYSVSFKAGEMVAVQDNGVSAGFMDGEEGILHISNANYKLPDNRAKGRLQYVGKRYLKWAEIDRPFLKTGADSPENMLHYADFDGTLDAYGKLGKQYYRLMKDWAPHQGDYEPSAAEYTWKNGKGKNLLGAINYLSKVGVNAISFLTMSIDGDDGGVYPHLVKDDSVFIARSQESRSWINAVHQQRFDCSKLDQWERIFAYAESKGMFLHFKTFENENVWLMGTKELTMERKLYYRELIARYAHHLALNWNLSEETNVDVALIKKTASYIRLIDPYQNHVVQHTFPLGHGKGTQKPTYEYYYPNLVGQQSELTGASLQLQVDDIYTEVKRWVLASAKSGKPWVVANDEQGGAGVGVTVDENFPGYTGKMKLDNRDMVRDKVLWATFMAGGAGVEYYYGYDTEQNDLNAQDHRSREKKYQDAAVARKFFESIDVESLQPLDDAYAGKGNYALGNDSLVLIYMPKGGAASVQLEGKNWKGMVVDPKTGKTIKQISIAGNKISAPNSSQDWVVVIRK